MKKVLTIIILLFIASSFIYIPNYLELNELIIIDSININCENKTINYNEIIPYKDNNSIAYKYKEYSYTYENINEFFNMKNIYYKKAEIKWNNCKNEQN